MTVAETARRAIMTAMKSLRWDQEHFKTRLRVVLTVRGVTQKQLAKRLNVAPATVSRWQRSESNYPSLDHLQAAAEFLDLEAGWLAFGTGNPPPGLAVALLSPKVKEAKPKPVRGRKK